MIESNGQKWNMPLSELGLMAIQYLGTPYIYGGECPQTGLDCSAFMRRVLMPFGLAPAHDITAQGLYDYLLKRDFRSQLGQDSVLFYGPSRNKINHIALAITDNLMIESGGGDETTKTIKEALQRDARVRIVHIRKNKLIASLKVTY